MLRRNIQFREKNRWILCSCKKFSDLTDFWRLWEAHWSISAKLLLVRLWCQLNLNRLVTLSLTTRLQLLGWNVHTPHLNLLLAILSTSLKDLSLCKSGLMKVLHQASGFQASSSLSLSWLVWNRTSPESMLFLLMRSKSTLTSSPTRTIWTKTKLQQTVPTFTVSTWRVADGMIITLLLKSLILRHSSPRCHTFGFFLTSRPRSSLSIPTLALFTRHLKDVVPCRQLVTRLTSSSSSNFLCRKNTP